MIRRAIIGIDCATDPARTGLALADAGGERPRILEVAMAADRDLPHVERIALWAQRSRTVLFAVDAPLGWPAPLGDALAGHSAGERLTEAPDRLFQRETDRAVRRLVGRRPLEVGADRIARTAVAALSLLEALRARLGERLPLAWDGARLERSSAIEVYPAATLVGRSLPASGYKKAGDRDRRQRMIERLEAWLDLPRDCTRLIEQADILDAVICTLAGWDFLRGETVAPADPAVTAREGWIWVRPGD